MSSGRARVSIAGVLSGGCVSWGGTVLSGGCVLVLLQLLLPGCAVGPDFRPPPAPSVTRYTAQPPTTETEDQEPPADWWKSFGSSQIDDLVESALRANPTLQAARATLRQSLENVAAQRGLYFPSLQGSAEASRNRDAVQVLSPTLTSGAASYSLFTPQLTVTFVPDLLGGNRRQVEALQAKAEANRDQYEAAYLTLIANVVGAAIQDAGLRSQIAATREVIELHRASLEVMRRQLELGAIAESDGLAQDAALAQVEATLPPLQKALDLQHDLLAALTGSLPAAAADPSFALDELQRPKQVPIGVPSRLVERRPDVRAAEAQLHAATAEVGVSIANMLPQLTLSGAIGSVSTQAAELFQGGSEFWTLGASLTQTLFSGGSLLHRERAARAGVDIAGAQYRLTVLTAFQDVADALHALHADAAALQAQERAYTTAHQSLQIIRRQFELGAISYLSLLNAQQSYQQAAVGRAQALTSLFADTAALYQALGGHVPDADMT